MGVRIFQLAKELGMPSKDLINYLQTQGVKAKSHMASVDENVAQILRDRMPRKAPAPAKGAGAKPAKAGVGTVNGGKAATSRTGPGGATTTGVAAAKKDDSRPTWGPDKPSADSTDARRKAKTPAGAKARPAPPARKRFFPGASDYQFDSGNKRSGGQRRPHGRGDVRSAAAPLQNLPENVTVQLPVTIKEFSAQIGLKVPSIMKTLMKKGHMLNMNSYLTEDLLLELGVELNVDITAEKERKPEEAVVALENFDSAEENLVGRPPVVTFLGHVDHGKTSLLDYIRKTKVTSREHGGITQHIGAYRVDDGETRVVFIDTPGHQAFTEMRARGANLTDVAVLIVAADEGLMPQTEEAYNHAKAAEVPVIVALNKMDKPGANPQRCHEQLSKLGLIPVAWGGDTEFVEVSAQTGNGIDNLLETLSLESEILELKSDPTRPAIGAVLEAESNPGRGILATVLVQDGTLKQGDYVLCGHAHGRVRNLWLNGTTPVTEAGPASPVQISGLNDLPEVGERLYVFEDAQEARAIADDRLRLRRDEHRSQIQKITLDNIWDQLDSRKEGELNLIIKSDVKGTLEALRTALEDLGTEEVSIRVIHAGVGAIGQDDILLGDASNAIVLGFNVSVDDRARGYAEGKVEIRTYKVIYEALDDIKLALQDKLAPTLREVVQGTVEIRKVYHASKIGSIAGSYVTKGVIVRDSRVRLIRDNQVIHTGTLDSLKRFKDDVKEVKEGFECGIKIAGTNDIREGDVVQAFKIVKEKRTL